MLVPPAVSTIFLNGSFPWIILLTPDVSSASMLTTDSIIRNDLLIKSLVHDYLKNEISLSFFENMTKAKVIHLMVAVDAIERNKAPKLFSEISLSDGAHLLQGLTFFVNWCEQNKNILEIRSHLDK